MLINIRNVLMSGKRLPYDAEVEYLQFVGFDTYIDTGVYPNATTDCEVGVSFAGSNTNYPTPIGMVDGTTRYLIRYGSPDSFFQLSAGNGVAFTEHARNGPSSVNIGYPKTFKISGGKSYVDGVQTSTLYNSVVNLDDFRYTLWVGNQNYQGGFNQNCSATNMQITFCKIWKGNTLVRDLIPVRKGTVGYLYDRVTRKLFGNAGTGDFVPGPDVVPVEYLSNGDNGSYINTGVTASKTISAIVDGSVLNPAARGNGNLVFLYGKGISWAYNSYGLFFQSEQNQADVGRVSFHGRNTRLSSVLEDETDIVINISANGTDTATITGKIGGNLVSDSASISGVGNYFSMLWSRGIYAPGAISIKRLEMYDSGALVRKFLPVRVGTDATSWDGAMMDVLTRRVYRNAGTGAFTYGNDLKYPIPAE